METFPLFLQDNTTIDWAALTAKECLKYEGQLVGNNCDYVPDITLMSFILFFGTYTCSMALKKFKTSRYFPTTVSISRHLISLAEGTGQPSFGVAVLHTGRDALQGSLVALVGIKVQLVVGSG